MSTKHTPGPWRVDRYPRTDGGVGFQVWNDGTASIANLSPGKTTDRVEDVAAANARLIAAAPELLAALESMFNYANMGAYERADAMMAARAAIAKARGA